MHDYSEDLIAHESNIRRPWREVVCIVHGTPKLLYVCHRRSRQLVLREDLWSLTDHVEPATARLISASILSDGKYKDDDAVVTRFLRDPCCAQRLPNREYLRVEARLDRENAREKTSLQLSNHMFSVGLISV
jgi:hypothetical protein